jgi:hypothetical protein
VLAEIEVIPDNAFDTHLPIYTIVVLFAVVPDPPVNWPGPMPVSIAKLVAAACNALFTVFVDCSSVGRFARPLVALWR